MAKTPAKITPTKQMTAAQRRTQVSAAGVGPPPSQSFSPFKQIGGSGVAVWGGRVSSRERSALLNQGQRWMTYGDIVANISIVAAGVRYFLNIMSHTKWTVSPKMRIGEEEPSDEAKRVADFIQEVIDDMLTPWRQVIRKAATYRFYGFGIQEWNAKKRQDGTIGLENIEARPQHTIERWQVDMRGKVDGVWQVPPQTGQFIYLPRPKLIYMVDDTLTDAPDGMGLFRHLVDPWQRLQKYLTLEGRGFERDLRGIPIGRVPYQALNASVKAGVMAQAEADAVKAAIESFVQIQSKAEDTSIVLDSAPYVVDTDSGKSISGVMQYGLELLNGQSPDFAAMSGAVNRLTQDMARILGVEHLLLGGDGGANRALSEDKSRNFYLMANGTLDDVGDNMKRDAIAAICILNGIPEELWPNLTHSDVSFRTVDDITNALGKLATAGAPLSPNDPAINEVREMLSLSPAPEKSLEEIAMMMGVGQGGEEGEEGAPGEGKDAPPGKEGEEPPKDGEGAPSNAPGSEAGANPAEDEEDEEDDSEDGKKPKPKKPGMMKPGKPPAK